MKNSKKVLLLFSVIIAILTVGLVCKQFQNDTFFYIAIGEHILENGIDMQEHFSWTKNLSYTFSHWAFDIIIFLIYQLAGFSGIYIGLILLSIITMLTMFLLLYKRTNSPFTSLFITLVNLYTIYAAFAARSQVVSFLCFIIEIYCIEKYIETNKKKYGVILCILSIVIANIHAATWPLFLILFLPYIGAKVITLTTPQNLYKLNVKKYENKLKKLNKKSKEYSSVKKDLEHYENLASKESSPLFSKITSREHYNTKNLIILLIIILFTGLLTPIKDVPFTYIIHSMFGESNFGDSPSIDYVIEMQPIIPANNLEFLVFLSLFIALLAFLPTKLKLEHGFLVLGLLLMTLSSRRYVYLLVLLGSYVLADLLAQSIEKFLNDDIKSLENFLIKPKVAIGILVYCLVLTTSNLIDKIDIPYIDKSMYPVEAVSYIKENLNYKDIKIYNSYNNGSYLMMHGIPVFIDSRLDVYCSEFNDTDIFRDYIKISQGETHYEEIFSKYEFTHVLLYKNEIVTPYVKEDPNYKLLHEDDFFYLFERKSMTR